MDRKEFQDRWELSDEIMDGFEDYLRRNLVGGWWELHCLFLRCSQPLRDTLGEVLDAIAESE